jgi:SAM-dependent methyltransferase
MATNSHVDGAYRRWKSWDASDFAVLGAAQQIYFDAEIGAAFGHVDSTTTILEIGFGNGQFAAWARSRGASYYGTELDSQALDLGRNAGIHVFPATLNLDSIAGMQRFDLIVAFDVLEHLSTDEILSILTSARRALKSHGIFVARYPNGDSPFGRAAQHGDLTHKTTIGSGVIRYLAPAAGLKILQLRTPAFPLRRLGVARMIRRLVVLAAQRLISAVLMRAFFDNEAKVMTANVVAVMTTAPVP